MDFKKNDPLSLKLEDFIQKENLNGLAKQFVKSVFLAIYENLNERKDNGDMILIFPPFGANRRELVTKIAHLIQLHVMEIKNDFIGTYIVISTIKNFTPEELKAINCLNYRITYLINSVKPQPPPDTTQETSTAASRNTNRFNLLRSQLETIPEVDEDVNWSENAEQERVNPTLSSGLNNIIEEHSLNELGEKFVRSVFRAIYNNLKERTSEDFMTIIFPPFEAHLRNLVTKVSHLLKLHVIEISNHFNGTYLVVSTKKQHTLEEIKEIDLTNCQFNYLVSPVTPQPPPDKTPQISEEASPNTSTFNFVRNKLETIPEDDEEVDLSSNEETKRVEGEDVENTLLLENNDNVRHSKTI